jgi:hypothetical protein
MPLGSTRPAIEYRPLASSVSDVTNWSLGNATVAMPFEPKDASGFPAVVNRTTWAPLGAAPVRPRKLARLLASNRTSAGSIPPATL